MNALSFRLLMAVLVCAFCTVAHAEERTLRVGVFEKPPYCTRDSDGQWQGVSIELWKSIALLEGYRTEWVDTSQKDMMDAVASGSIDVGAGEVEVTAAGERLVDYTQPYLESSIGVAVREGNWHLDWWELIRAFFNIPLLVVVLAMLVGMLVVSALIWFFEREHHAGHFRGGLTGIGSAFWFSAVTVTTVGYGDKTPSTLAGRVVSLVWMFMGVLLIAAFTGTVASTVATAKIGRTISSVADLGRVSCCVVEGSLSQDLLRRKGIPAQVFKNIDDAVAAVAAQQVDAIVADRVTLSYMADQMAGSNGGQRMELSPLILRTSFVALAVHPGLPEYEKIKVRMLETIESSAWQDVLRRWLGRQAVAGN